MALLALAIGQQPAPDRIILLPDADGQVGKIIVSSSGNQQLLDTAYAATEVDAKGQITPRSEDAASVQARYGELLRAQPPRPASFTVYFVTGSAQELTAESRQTLERLKETIAQRPAPDHAPRQVRRPDRPRHRAPALREVAKYAPQTSG